MKIAKKSLSIFLAFLMLFSACSVGLTGVVASAAAGDSKYQASEVVALINAAIEGGYSSKSVSDATAITGDNGDILAAAEAIYDYAIKTYRDGKKADSAKNSGDTLYTAFVNEFTSKFSGTAAQNAMKALALDILNPNGTNVYGYENKQSGSSYTVTGREESFDGEDVTDSVPSGNWNSAVKENVKKTVTVSVDLEKYLLQFDSLADVPATIYTGISYTYNYAVGKSAIIGTIS